MKRYSYVLLFTILLFMTSNVKAAACDNKEKVIYQERAKNISYSYSYNDSDNTFSVVFTNVTNGLYLVDNNNDEIYSRKNLYYNIYL